MANTQFDSLWPWLRSGLPEDLSGVRLGGGAADPMLEDASFGLSSWQAPDALLRPPWLEPEADPGSFGLGTGIVDPNTTTPSFGLSSWRPSASVQQQTGGNADASQGLSNWRPPYSAEQPPIGFRMRPDGSIDESRAGFEPFDTGGAAFGGAPPDDTERRAQLQPWWSEISHPWLRADAEHEQPAFDGTPEARAPGDSRLPFGAPTVGQRPTLENTASDRAQPLSNATTTRTDLRPAAAGVMAATANAATAGGASGSQIIGEVLSKMAELAGRAAPAVAGAPAAVAGALPLLFIPTNTQSETIDLEDGVRARVSPGQRTVEIERRVGTGLFGTGLGARWERLPVDAEMRVGKDGAATLVIDHGQLRQALNPAEDRDAATSEMARRPDKVKDRASQPAADMPPNSGEVLDPGNGRAPASEHDKAPDPRNNKTPGPHHGGPPLWGHVMALASEILEKGRQAKSVDAERIDACRKVMKEYGQQAPDGQYRGPDGRDTAAGVRLNPNLPDPASGIDYSPERQNLLDGVKGEQELANRIKQLNPKETIIHFGPAAGVQGPDIMSISEKGEVAFWDSKWRNREQSIPPSQRTNRTERSFNNLRNAEQHIQNAVADGTLSKEVAAKAMANLIAQNFLLCTVGTGQAHQGVVEIVKGGERTGPL